jgi:hypothetical protein
MMLLMPPDSSCYRSTLLDKTRLTRRIGANLLESVGEILDGCLRAKLKEALEGTAKRDGQTMERLAARRA